MTLPKGIAKTGHRLIKKRTCGCCGKTHRYVPKKAPFQSELYWWDCDCGSTLVAYANMVYKKNTGGNTPPVLLGE